MKNSPKSFKCGTGEKDEENSQNKNRYIEISIKNRYSEKAELNRNKSLREDVRNS